MVTSFTDFLTSYARNVKKNYPTYRLAPVQVLCKQVLKTKTFVYFSVAYSDIRCCKAAVLRSCDKQINKIIGRSLSFPLPNIYNQTIAQPITTIEISVVNHEPDTATTTTTSSPPPPQPKQEGQRQTWQQKRNHNNKTFIHGFFTDATTHGGTGRLLHLFGWIVHGCH